MARASFPLEKTLHVITPILDRFGHVKGRFMSIFGHELTRQSDFRFGKKYVKKVARPRRCLCRPSYHLKVARTGPPQVKFHCAKVEGQVPMVHRLCALVTLSAGRTTAQLILVQYARLNLTPASAKRSMFGVWITGLP